MPSRPSARFIPSSRRKGFSLEASHPLAFRGRTEPPACRTERRAQRSARRGGICGKDALYGLRRTQSPHARSAAILLVGRNGLHLRHLRAALSVPLPEAPLHARAPYGRARGGAALLRCERQGTPRRRPRRSDRRFRVRHSDSEGNPLCAAPGLREGPERKLPLPRPFLRRGKDKEEARRLRRARHARTHRARLRARHPPHRKSPRRESHSRDHERPYRGA